MQPLRDIKIEAFSLEPHNPAWAELFEAEKEFLIKVLPPELIGKIEHIGSTAVVGIKAKPIVDILMEVKSQDQAKDAIAPVLVSYGYEHIVHNGLTKDEPVESSWFIKRNDMGERIAHIWCAEPNTPIWRRVVFVQYLNKHPEVAKEYESLKVSLLTEFPNERRQYLAGKSDFINKVTELALNEESINSNLAQ